MGALPGVNLASPVDTGQDGETLQEEPKAVLESQG